MGWQLSRRAYSKAGKQRGRGKWAASEQELLVLTHWLPALCWIGGLWWVLLRRMASEQSPPLNQVGAMLIMVMLTTAALISMFLPRLWRKGCSKTWRWFARTSADGPCYRCCCTCLRRSIGRLTTGAPAAPVELSWRAVTSSNATLAWKHTPESFLADDSFELELKKDGTDEWVSVYSGANPSHREKRLDAGSIFSARVRTVNHAGQSAWSEETQFLTRQVPFKNGGRGPCLEPAVAELIGKETLTATENEEACAYSWTQTDDEVTISLACPAGCRGRDLEVEFRPTSLKVVHRPSQLTLMEGPLYANVKHTDCYWDLDEDECVLTLGLEKSVKADSIALEHTERWSCVVAGHPQIDINIKGEERPSIHETLGKHLNR